MSKRYLNLNLIFIFFIISIFCQKSMAQERFGAAIIGGANFAQINGDEAAGYNKFGLRGGIRGIIYLKEKMDFSTEIAFSQRGSKSGINSPFYFKINLQYIEIPLQIHLKDWKNEDEDYYRVHFSGGLAISRLIGASSENTVFVGKTEAFNPTDVSFLASATYFSSKHFGLELRYTRSINYLYNPDKNTTVRSNPLIGFFISLNGIYAF